MPRSDYGFERTKCNCPRCSRFCGKMSGYLAPEDLDRMRMALGGLDYISFGLEYLMASPGATVGYQGRDGEMHHMRIHTLVPRRLEGGRCIFLEDDGKCKIHEDSPFGCAMIDEHMTDEEANRRSLTALQDIASQNFGGPFFQIFLAYEMLLAILSFHDQVAMPPEIARQGL
jgi:Fe-S-cluster containining protein